MNSRFPHLLGALAAVTVVVAPLTAGCEDPVGETVSCERLWICEGQVILEDVGENAKTFCTDPSSDARDEQMETYVSEFASTCDNIFPECNVGGVAGTVVCEATCAISGGECPLSDVVAVKL